jgi:hypothetical protein
MLDKMDALTQENPSFNAGSGGFFSSIWNALTGNVNACVTTTEQILGAGGITDSSSTPSGLWDDLYTNFSGDPDINTDFGSQCRTNPTMGAKYGNSVGQRSALDAMSDAADEAKRQAEERQKQPNQ